MKQIRILVVPSDRTGVGMFRSTKPHIYLEKLYPEEFKIDIEYQPKIDNDEWLSQYDIIHFHRTLGPYERMTNWVDNNGITHEGTMERLERLGIVGIMDLDDYWSPGQHHPAYLLIKKNKLPEKIVNNLKIAHYVSTTTPIFEKEIQKFNKNTIIFPNAIDPEEKQYIPNPEPSDRIRIGWIGGSCLTPDTEILTDKGWKFFQDLDETEKVATLNQETNEVEYHLPNKYIEEIHDGPIYVCDTNEVSFSVTGNHNMYVSPVKNLGHKKLNFKLEMQDNLLETNYHVKKDGINTNPDIEYFTLPALEINGRLYDYSEKKILMDDWLKFFGFWLGDGWTDKNNNSVLVAQYKDNDYLNVIFEILNKYNFNPKFLSPKKDVKEDTVIRMCHKQLFEYLKQFGKAWEKFIPRELLNTLSERQLNILLEWYLKADGSSEKTGDYIRRRAYTVSKQLADDLMELAFKVGEAASIKNRGLRAPRTSLNENGDERFIIPRHEAYQIGFYSKTSKHNKLNPLVRSEKIKTEHYQGFVRCVNVKNNVIYVRRNGKALWVGNSHLRDLEILRGLVAKLKSDNLLDRVQFVLCGYDLRGTITMIDEKTGEEKQRKITPQESVWYKYEQIFTDNYTTVSPEYKNFLLKFKKNEEYPNVANEPYRRVWTKHISSYALNYNLFDISLAPLEENTFNLVKSQLKVIEAGFHKKALIAQDFGPYQIDCINAHEMGGTINPEGNAFLIPSVKNHKQWYQYIKKLILNPEIINTLAENLYKTVKDTYSMETITKKRAEFYKKIINK